MNSMKKKNKKKKKKKQKQTGRVLKRWWEGMKRRQRKTTGSCLALRTTSSATHFIHLRFAVSTRWLVSLEPIVPLFLRQRTFAWATQISIYIYVPTLSKDDTTFSFVPYIFMDIDCSIRNVVTTLSWLCKNSCRLPSFYRWQTLGFLIVHRRLNCSWAS